ncbi:MAG: tol-pal system protein YbgF [Desulfobacteraceae bacterium]|nr:tol-pal system protein YbgF [Desulfobacteraceae bacterium]
MNNKTLIALCLLGLFLLSSDSQWRVIAAANTGSQNQYQHEAAMRLYQEAISEYYKHNHERAASLFRDFATAYPRHPMADKAYLWIKFIDKSQTQSRESAGSSEALYHQAIAAYYRRDMQESLRLFNEFASRYPDHSLRDKAYNWINYIERNLQTDTGDKVIAETLYNRALDAYYRQGSAAQAFSLLKALIEQYPATEFAVKAQYWIAYLRKTNPDKMSGFVVKTPNYSADRPENSKPVKEPDEAEKLYQRGISAYQQKKYREAASVLGMFLENYPKHPMADRVSYWLGECFYAQNNFYDAINTFKEVAIKYPASTKIADALLMIGNSYFSLNDLPNARSFFERVIRNHPSSSAAETARRKLEQLKSKEKPSSPLDDKLQVYRRKKEL